MFVFNKKMRDKNLNTLNPKSEYDKQYLVFSTTVGLNGCAIELISSVFAQK